MDKWKEQYHQARLEEVLPGGVVKCHLSPRNCTLSEGQSGFCRVRANRAGRLVTLNFGKSVHVTEETIETEAVNHFSPGAPILSLGNIGCMLNCSYCHNWKTSQAKYVEDKDVYYYTPREIIDIALRHHVKILSWTYNDPVVWHEFVLETAKLAKEAGLMNLYKSAFFITNEAVEELLPYIDIFSISIKSMDPKYYKRFTKGWLEPVLEATKLVHKAGKHLELSTLMITDVSDNEKTAKDVASWILNDLDSSVPLHFVRFHPDYQFTNTIRTPIPRLEKARELAIEMGMEHVYLGNVYDTQWTNTYCNKCGALLVKRYGLCATIESLDAQGNCLGCGRYSNIKRVVRSATSSVARTASHSREVRIRHSWRGDIRAAHVQVKNDLPKSSLVSCRRALNGHFNDEPFKQITLGPNESYRFALAKSYTDESGFELTAAEHVSVQLHDVFDRAHFPTVSVDDGIAPNDISPLPLHHRQLRVVQT